MKKVLMATVALLALVVLGWLGYVVFERWRLKTTNCPHSSPTTVTIPLVVASPGTIIGPSPGPGICPGDTVVWTIENKCQACGKVKVKIDDRNRRHPDSCAATPTISEDKDCFKKKFFQKCKPEKEDVSFGDPPATIGDCTVKADAQNGCYKYSLKGTYDIDPEVEVQGGVPFHGKRTPQASPSR